MGTTIPPSATTRGSASRRRSPMSNSRRASQAGHQEEERHQPGVHPALPAICQAPCAGPDHQLGVPCRGISGWVDVGPGQRRQGGGQQDRRAARLGAQEPAKRRLQVLRPHRARGKPRGGPAGLGHSRILSRAAPAHDADPSGLGRSSPGYTPGGPGRFSGRIATGPGHLSGPGRLLEGDFYVLCGLAVLAGKALVLIRERAPRVARKRRDGTGISAMA